MTLALGTSVQLIASLSGQLGAPWAYAAWLVLAFGAWCLCDELGMARPLNRAGAVLLAAAFCARSMLLCAPATAVATHAQLLYAFAALGMIMFWSVALMHRPDRPKVAGLLGSTLSGAALGLLIVAHVVTGSIGYFGFGALFVALNSPDADVAPAMTVISAVLWLWSLLVAGLLWTTALAGIPSTDACANGT